MGRFKVFGIVSIFVFFAFMALLYATYTQGFWRFNTPSLQQYPVQGIDVSHHQGDIDWPRVPKDHVRFVYIKATEGGDYKDPSFQKNWTEARRSGFQVGAYHFFSFCKTGAVQSQNFIHTVPLADNILPPVIDLEFTGNCSKRPSRADFLADLTVFSDVVEKYYGIKPVFYTTYAFYDAYLQGSVFENARFWVRDIFHKPSRSVFRNIAFWQYADSARLNGIRGPVDLNVMFPEGR